jgi:hypothetical protein
MLNPKSIISMKCRTKGATKSPESVLDSARYPVVAAFGLLMPLALVGVTSMVHGSDARTAVADKREYTLFNPTPGHLLRELSADRPDFTESPFTVDAGHFQVELSFLEYSRNQSGGGVDQYSILPINLKLGLLNQVDLQLLVNPYVRVETDDGTIDGFGDLQLRTKVNLWGNDSGTTALALMPFVQFPTAADDLGSERVEGGLIVPLSFELPGKWLLGLMAELDIVRNSGNDDYGIEFVHTVALGREIAGPLGGYVEYIGIAPHRTGAGYEALIGLGLTYGLSDQVQLDGGANFGLSGGTEDVALFSGITFRL